MCAPGSTTSEVVNRRSRLAVSWALGVLAGAGLAGSQHTAEPALLDATRASLRAELPRAGSRIRIGVATDLTELRLPCCQEGLRLRLGPSRGVEIEGSVRVTPAVEGESTFRLQVAALEDVTQAELLARRLEQLTGVSASSSFDAGLGLFRVRVGRFSNREEAAAMKARFEQRGLGDAWIVSEGRLSGTPALGVTMGSISRIFHGRWLGFDRRGGESIRVAGHRYRGTIYVYLNDRGLLNLINELPLEDYLRGVVPLEMGPALYGEMESLKAQAVAARTYAVRNLNDFESEGYDLCATARCQVYGGLDVEHPLSDRAVRETVAEVLLHNGRLVDALYSSSCGGSTEDVEVVFPQKVAAYLRAVPCIEGPHGHIAGSLATGTALPRALLAVLLPSAESPGSREELEGRLRGLAELSSVPTPRDHLLSLEPSEVRRFVASIFDLALDPLLFRETGARERRRGGTEKEWSVVESRLRSLLLARNSGGLRRSEIDGLLLDLAMVQGLVRFESAHYLAVDGRRLSVRIDGEVHVLTLPDALATLRPLHGSLRTSSLDLSAGDRLRLFWHRDQLLGLVQEHDAGEVTAMVENQSWVRYRSDSDLEAAVAIRYPGFLLKSLAIEKVGTSGRVGSLRLTSTAGETFAIRGLAVRWTLDLPDTLFTVHRRTGDSAGWVFRGRGRGHGVGLCQKGSYAMALRGLTYLEILTHYYSGIAIERLPL